MINSYTDMARYSSVQATSLSISSEPLYLDVEAEMEHF